MMFALALILLTQRPQPDPTLTVVSSYSILLDMAAVGHRRYQVGIDVQRKDSCHLLELEQDGELVFSLPCSKGDEFMAEHWTSERAYSCIHEVMNSVVSRDTTINPEIVTLACSEED